MKRGLIYTLHIHLRYRIIYAIQINRIVALGSGKYLLPFSSVNYRTLLAILTDIKGF